MIWSLPQHLQLPVHRSYYLQPDAELRLHHRFRLSKYPAIPISIRKKNNWIDFNCGALVDGGTIGQMGEALFEYVLEVASGRLVKAEEAGFHDMAIFKQGVTL